MKFRFLLLSLLFSCKLFAQSSNEKFKSALMEKKGGAAVIYSSDKHSFTLDIISDNIKPLQQPGYVSVDNKILQFVFSVNDSFKQTANTEEEQKTRLLGYMQYELEYAKNELKVNYTELKFDWITINNKLYLLWYYDMPVGKKIKKGTVLKQINLSTLCFEHALNLNTPFEQQDSLETDKNFLLKVARTLKQNDFEIDFDALYNELQKN